MTETDIQTTNQLDCFKKFFVFDDGYSSLKEVGINSGFDTMDIRSIAWRIFLGALHGICGNGWIEETQQQRNKYQMLVDKLENGPIREKNLKKLTEESDTIPDPLSINEKNPWCQHFNEMDVEKRVGVDILRLFSEYDFFRNDQVREHIKRVCVIYSLEHSELQYNQGFHELVGVLYYCISRDIQSWKGTKDVMDNLMKDEFKESINADVYKVMSYIFDEQYMEHDAYTMFDLLMHSVTDFYDPNETRNSTIESPDGSATHTKLMIKCDKLFKELEKLDNQLYLHLKYEGIHLVIFGTRWLRLLFDREFHVMDVLNVWDAIFAYGNNLEFVDYLFLAMMVQIREPILESSQYSTTMMLFMKYPDIKDIHDVINLAKELADKKGDYDPLPYIKPLSGTTLTQKVMEMGTKQRAQKKQEEFTIPKHVQEDRSVVEQQQEQQKTEQQQKKKEEAETNELVKQRIKHSIQLLSSSINNEGVISDPSGVVEALSELKLVNAVMNGLLPTELADGYFNIFDKKE
ncbi:hypothetical protein ENUP19_0265G0029 [Entamoeba nuttalli]|uniref:Rab GTPase activating protein, putative n=2 Tax=Entamoeba nuttalli TaxID=412467 RepID=K2H3E3_ENTNP|nr:Rab GTPase activating protein, putative [Entamoeba nuttalli P19]EKE36954.1 Rab GTPase activating protein, putative [Entamoeba nuttalli P19]|eukprot:XP_008860694.1 Rab GTPase activating protein, putative [Entamoeba nuttalli P19]